MTDDPYVGGGVVTPGELMSRDPIFPVDPVDLGHHRACNHAHQDTWDRDALRRAWERSTGWHVVSPNRPRYCPRQAITGRHASNRKECCMQHYDPRALDHGRVVRRVLDGRRGFLAMPYGLDELDADTVTAWLRPQGFRWFVHPEPGWHFHGTLSLFVVRVDI